MNKYLPGLMVSAQAVISALQMEAVKAINEAGQYNTTPKGVVVKSITLRYQPQRLPNDKQFVQSEVRMEIRLHGQTEVKDEV